MKKETGKKIILITGCLGGIGSVMVDFFKEKGWFVIGTDKRESFSNADIKITTDLNKVEDSTDQVLKTVNERKITHIDALINNAAIQIKKNFGDFTYEDWIESFNVNVIAGYMLIKKLRKHLHDGR